MHSVIHLVGFTLMLGVMQFALNPSIGSAQSDKGQYVTVSAPRQAPGWLTEGLLYGMRLTKKTCVWKQIQYTDEGYFYLSNEVAILPIPLEPKKNAPTSYTNLWIKICIAR